jgi:type I restriction-modification system DNA methylase subunit
MNHKVLNYLKEYSSNVEDINGLLVSAFLRINRIDSVTNTLIKNYLIDQESASEYNKLQDFILLFDGIEFTFEKLIAFFEFVISPIDKEVNGAVYTPKYIREFIIRDCDDETSLNSKVCDVACGCGGFLYEYALYLHNKGKKIQNIIQDNLFGIDITGYSIERTKILLSLFAILEGEDRETYNFNLFQGNSLDFDWFDNCAKIRESGGFDYIFSNPPYVGSTNLDQNTKDLIKTWKVSSTGKLDLYIPFFELGMKWLKEGGTLGYITVNNFYRSLNGRALRSYFSMNIFDFTLIDFGGEQVFKGRNTYTCICKVKKDRGVIRYTSTNSKNLNNLNESEFIESRYEELDDLNGWRLDSLNVKLNLNRIESIGEKLVENFDIRNGFATLRNNIYLFTPKQKDKDFYYFEKDNKTYQIEKEVCKDAIKPNILKSEKDLYNFNEKLIFPYTRLKTESKDLFSKNSTLTVKVISENEFSEKYPFANAYLKDYKEELAKRDKGTRKYETWFAFGRSQALNITGKKLLFPYLSNAPYFVYTGNEELLFYNGYAILSDSEDDLRFIQKILQSDIFWYYIKHTSKPYSGDYFALAKNYVKNFSIPNFTISEKKYFLKLKRKNSINKFLIKKYNLVDVILS